MKTMIVSMLVLFMAGCVTVPEKTFAVTPEKLQDRQLQTRRYDGIAESQLIIASANVLQDIGFNLGDSETKLGMLTGNKQRDISSEERAGEVALLLLAAAFGGNMPLSTGQNIKVSLVVRPVLGSSGEAVAGSNYVRVTFQRVVGKSDGTEVSQTLKEPELYTEFFEKVSKAVFIEAQKI